MPAPFDDSSSEGVLRHEADDEHRILRIADIVLEVMLYPSPFTHARCGDDDTGPGVVIERFGLLHIGDVLDSVASEGIVTATEHFVHLFIEAFRMSHEDVGYVDRQRAVDTDRYIGYAILEEQLIEVVDDFLCSLECK